MLAGLKKANGRKQSKSQMETPMAFSGLTAVK